MDFINVHLRFVIVGKSESSNRHRQHRHAKCVSIYIKFYLSLTVCFSLSNKNSGILGPILDSKLSDPLLKRKIAKIVIYDKERVNGGINYDSPGLRWVPELVYCMQITCF